MNTIIRLENAALAIAALFAFHYLSSDWWFFALLILLPDLGLVGYLHSPKLGAICYNALHSWIVPVALLGFAIQTGNATVLLVALIWAIHIGADRALGLGLKYFSAFKDTHLGEIGRK